MVAVRRIIILIISGGFVFLKVLNLHPRASDENLYFWAGHVLTQGILPYRDYFLAVGPGQVVLYGILDFLFGFRFVIVKLIVVLVSLATGVTLWRLLANQKQETSGIAAAALFLFSSSHLGASDHAAGVHEAIFLLVLFWYLLERRSRLAGIVLTLALVFRFYVLPAALGILVFEYLWGKREVARRAIVWSFIPFLLINVLLVGFSGEKYIEEVWVYHLLKPGVSVHRQAAWDFLRNERFLLLAAAGGAVMLLVGRRRSRVSGRELRGETTRIDLGKGALVAVLAQSIFLGFFSARFLVYFVPLLPFLSILASLFLTQFLPLRSRALGYAAVGFLSVLNLLIYQRNFAGKYRVENLTGIVADTQSHSKPRESIFGTYLVTPLVALEAERAITENEADTNIQRYLAGLLSSERATRLATGSAVFLQSAAVGEDGAVLGVDPAYVDSKVVVQHCRPVNRYPLLQDFGFNTLVVWACPGK